MFSLHCLFILTHFEESREKKKKIKRERETRWYTVNTAEDKSEPDHGKEKQHQYTSVAVWKVLMLRYDTRVLSFIQPVQNAVACLCTATMTGPPVCARVDEKGEKKSKMGEGGGWGTGMYAINALAPFCLAAGYHDQMKRFWHLQFATDMTLRLVRRPLNQVAGCHLHRRLSSACYWKLLEHMEIYHEQDWSD